MPIAITRAGNVVNITDGTRKLRKVYASEAVAKGQETRLHIQPDMAERWLEEAYAPRVAYNPAVTITRDGKAIIAKTLAGNVTRRFECRNVPCAVELEAKLARDKAFAQQWSRAGDPKGQDHVPHALERRKPGLS